MHTFLSSLSLPDLATAVFGDSKSILSMIIAAAGASATVATNWNALTERRTLLAKIKSKTERAQELVDLLNKLKETQEFASCRKRLRLEIDRTLSEIRLLRQKEFQRQNPPKGKLTAWQRIFILFPPVGPHDWIIHLFAYAFMFGGPLAILLLVLFGMSGESIFGDLTILVVFGALAFRGWALAQRNWARSATITPCDEAQAQINTDSLARKLFVMHKPLSRGMLAAQISLWIAIFCLLETLEDIVFAGMEPYSNHPHWSQEASGALCLFLISLVVVGLCRAWATAERSEGHRSSNQRDSHARLNGFPGILSSLAIISFYLAIALVASWKWNAIMEFWSEPWDMTEVIILMLVSGSAIFRLTLLRPVTQERIGDRRNSTEDPLPSFGD